MKYACDVLTDFSLTERIIDLQNYVFHSVSEGVCCQWHRYIQKGLEPKTVALHLL